MSQSNRSRLPIAMILAVFAFGLAGSSGAPISTPFPRGDPAPLPPTAAALPPAFPPQDIVGRWGLAAYHKVEDPPRTEAGAAEPSKKPYIIPLGTRGGR